MDTDDVARRSPPITGPAAASPGRLPRLLRAGPPGTPPEPADLASHLARFGPLPPLGNRQRRHYLAEVERAGLAGRGGAGFPAARKLAAVARGQRPVVVANGTEGEPASAKDKVLMVQSPHLVFDGAVAAADLVGAREVIVVAHPAVKDVLSAAAAERRRARLDRPAVRVLAAAERFVAGEASAVLHWIERGTPIPKASHGRLSDRGLHGRPTLVQNVETLAHLALIIRFGADWFRGVGTAQEPGSMLVTLVGAVSRPGVHEVAIGTPIGDVLALANPLRPLGALLIGGYFGSWADSAKAKSRPLSSAGLAPLGATLGAGVIGVIPKDACGLDETARIARYLADQSAGQCGPCVFGLDSIAEELRRLADGRSPRFASLHRWLGQMRHGRGACKHPDGTVGMVTSALDLFGPEIDQHARGWCRGTGARDVLPVPAWDGQ